MYKNLAATLVAACLVSPAFSQSPAPAKAPLKIAASTLLAGAALYAWMVRAYPVLRRGEPLVRV